MAQDPDFIARFRDYNDYLDSLIAEEDIRYLQDGELARYSLEVSRQGYELKKFWNLPNNFKNEENVRLIAELSYRGAGRTLTEREYDAEIERFVLFLHLWLQAAQMYSNNLYHRFQRCVRTRIEMAKKLKEMNENSDKEGDMLGKAADDGPLVTAIKQRFDI